MLKSISSNSFPLSASSRRPEDVKMRCMQNEEGVKITHGTENYLFSLFCTKNSFV